MSELDTCKYCHFEYDEDYNPFKDDGWDILDMREEDGWEHIQIKDRLHYKGIDCWSADIWSDDIALIVNIQGQCNNHDVAKALGVYEEVIYNDFEHGLMIINLFQEKCLRRNIRL